MPGTHERHSQVRNQDKVEPAHRLQRKADRSAGDIAASARGAR